MPAAFRVTMTLELVFDVIQIIFADIVLWEIMRL